jgi:anaerobic magnesium-protoporphyrin IX monomethyl ester cyclase
MLTGGTSISNLWCYNNKMNKIEKIMLAIPNDLWQGDLRAWHNFPYTFGVLTSVLKDKYDVNILDANLENLTPEQVKERVNNYKPDIFGISCLSIEYVRNFRKISSYAKEAYPPTKVVIGGIYPTLLPEEAMQDLNVDFAVLGEGEYRFPELLERLEDKKGDKKGLEDIDGLAYRKGKDGKVIIQPVINYIEDLDKLPLPSYDNVDFAAYANKANKYYSCIFPRRYPYAQTISARGCPFSCIFCSSQSINGPHIRFRSPKSVLNEVDWLVDKYGIKELLFLDDNFFLNKNRAVKIMEGLIERNYDLEWRSINAAIYALDEEMLELMKKSGTYQINVALEAATRNSLELLRKPLGIISRAKPMIKKAKELGFEITSSFIIGTPGETWEDIRKTFAFAEECDIDYCSFNIATPLPKTELYEIAKKNNLLPKDFSFDSLDYKGFGKSKIETSEFTSSELQVLRAFEWDRINFKTLEKRIRIARMLGIDLDELEQWRKDTRRGLEVRLK